MFVCCAPSVEPFPIATQSIEPTPAVFECTEQSPSDLDCTGTPLSDVNCAGPSSSVELSAGASPYRDLLQIIQLPKHQLSGFVRKQNALQSFILTASPQKDALLDKENKIKSRK